MVNRHVKIFTYVDRINDFVELWVKYYANTFSEIHITILYRNKIYDQLHDIVSPITTDFELIDINHLTYNKQSYLIDDSIFTNFQTQFLKNGWNIVIFADIDEFIVSKNLENLVQTQTHFPIVTQGVEIVHNVKHEVTFDFKKSITSQREYMVKSKWYNKPLITTSPIHWNAGKHAGIDQYPTPGVYLVHMGRICLDNYKKLQEKTKNQYSHHIAPHNTRDVDITKDYIANWNNPNHQDQPMIKIDVELSQLLSLIL